MRYSILYSVCLIFPLYCKWYFVLHVIRLKLSLCLRLGHRIYNTMRSLCVDIIWLHETFILKCQKWIGVVLFDSDIYNLTQRDAKAPDDVELIVFLWIERNRITWKLAFNIMETGCHLHHEELFIIIGVAGCRLHTPAFDRCTSLPVSNARLLQLQRRVHFRHQKEPLSLARMCSLFGEIL